MDENKSITYDDLIQTRNTQILKSIVPYLDVPTQKPLAMLIQLMEWKNATAAFSRQENSMAACSLPAGTKRRDAMLSAVRKYCTPKEQEMIDTIADSVLYYGKSGSVSQSINPQEVFEWIPIFLTIRRLPV